jgi:hypothetical protein
MILFEDCPSSRSSTGPPTALAPKVLGASEQNGTRFDQEQLQAIQLLGWPGQPVEEMKRQKTIFDGQLLQLVENYAFDFDHCPFLQPQLHLLPPSSSHLPPSPATRHPPAQHFDFQLCYDRQLLQLLGATSPPAIGILHRQIRNSMPQTCFRLGSTQSSSSSP